MDKKYAILLLIFFIAIIAVSGCAGQTKTQQIAQQAAFVGGTEGLKISFFELPPTIFAGVPFNLQVLLQNAGEADVKSSQAIFILNNARIFNITNGKAANREALARAKRVAGNI